MGWTFDYQIIDYEGGILEDPARYTGFLTSGGDGIIELWFDTSTWPADRDERFDSLWVWYFQDNYSGDPGSMKWAGSIPGWFYVEATNASVGYNGSCVCAVVAKITVRDLNENGTLEEWELKLKQHLFDGRLSKLCQYYDDGEMDAKRGFGALSSNYFSFYPPDPPNCDTLYNGGNLSLFPGCSTGLEPSNWGSIKALYR
jgi:hypothetical protein